MRLSLPFLLASLALWTVAACDMGAYDTYGETLDAGPDAGADAPDTGSPSYVAGPGALPAATSPAPVVASASEPGQPGVVEPAVAPVGPGPTVAPVAPRAAATAPTPAPAPALRPMTRPGKTSHVPRIRGFVYDEVDLPDPFEDDEDRPTPAPDEEDPNSAEPGKLDGMGRGWMGLVVDGRVLVAEAPDVDWLDHAHARWVRRTSRRWHARATVTGKALAGELAGWVGAPIAGVDARGRRCTGTLVGLVGEARAFLSERLLKDDDDERPRTPSDTFEAGGVVLMADVRWESRRCARNTLVVRKDGAPLPKVLKRVRTGGDDAEQAKRRFRWSAAWKLVQRRYEGAVDAGYLPAQRTWDGGDVHVATYDAGTDHAVVLATALTEEPCSEPGGSLGLRMDRSGGGDEPSIEDRWSYGHPGLPELLLHLEGSDTWVGVDSGKRMFLLGGEATSIPSYDVFVPRTCGC